MRARVVMIVALLLLLLLPQVAIAGGLLLEIKLSETQYGPRLGRHLREPESFPDGGLMAIGWWHRNWDVEASVMGHDAYTVNGGRKDGVVSGGVDIRHRGAVTRRLDLTLRGGVFGTAIYGSADTPLEHYLGRGVRAGAGLRFRTVTCRDSAVWLSAELVRNEFWLSSDGAKDLRDHTSHFLVGLEWTQVPDIGRRCAW
jgi:hypothetical protein